MLFVCPYCAWWGVFDTTVCDKVSQWLATVRLFSPGIPVSSTNKTESPRYNWNVVESGVKTKPDVYNNTVATMNTSVHEEKNFQNKPHK
jgi:hypothetical protein